ncbi:hypothetical protein [Bradyrhizobium sp. 143]|nr:hypothetical protein [Bradyrhizobium sp. 143]
MTLDLDDIGIFGDDPKRPVSVGLRPVDWIVSPQLGEETVLKVDIPI